MRLVLWKKSFMKNKKCIKCGQCCKSELGPFVFPDEVERISNNLNITPGELLSKYCVKHLIFTTDKNKFEIFSIKTDNNGCVFLKDNLCKIYGFRPFQCSHAPLNFMGNYKYWTHMTCIKEEDFKSINTREIDKKMFGQIIDIGYKKYTNSKERRK